jgi:hypothetical protein
MQFEIKLFGEMEKGEGVASGYELFPMRNASNTPPSQYNTSIVDSRCPIFTPHAAMIVGKRGRVFDKVAGMSLQHVVDLTGRECGGSSVLVFQI